MEMTVYRIDGWFAWEAYSIRHAITFLVGLIRVRTALPSLPEIAST
jgi:hypothetical protein